MSYNITTHSTGARITLISSAGLGFIDGECAPGQFGRSAANVYIDGVEE